MKPFFLFLLLSIRFLVSGQVYYDQLEKKIHPLRGRALADTILATPYSELVADFDGSLKMMHLALTASDLAGYNLGEGRACNQLSIIHYLRGAYDSASFYNFRAQGFLSTDSLAGERGSVLCGYGYMIKRRNLEEAFAQMRKGISLLETHQEEGHLTAAYDNFGVLHEMNNDLDSASFYYVRALRLKEEHHDSTGLPFSLNNLGGVELLRKHFDAALPWFERAYSIRLARHDTFGVMESQSLFGDLYRTWGKPDQAIIWYEKSLVGCDTIGYPYMKQYNLEKLSVVYEAVGRSADALTSLRISRSISDSLLNEKNLKQINELEQRFKLAEKDKSIALLEEKSARRRQYIIGITAVLSVILLLSMLAMQVQRRKARAEKDAAIIRERERGLDAVFTATEEERKRIAKDLHDGIGQQMSGIKLGFEALKNQLGPLPDSEVQRLKKLTEVIDESARDVRALSHQMMPKALQDQGLLPALEDMLHKSLGLSGIAFRVEHFQVQGERFDEKVEVGLYRVCQELVNNISKHSGADEVVVQLYRNKNYLVLIVEDNGRGFDANAKRDGMGLLNITSRLSVVGGEVTWEPGPEAGTVATVRVPV